MSVWKSFFSSKIIFNLAHLRWLTSAISGSDWLFLPRTTINITLAKAEVRWLTSAISGSDWLFLPRTTINITLAKAEVRWLTSAISGSDWLFLPRTTINITLAKAEVRWLTSAISGSDWLFLPRTAINITLAKADGFYVHAWMLLFFRQPFFGHHHATKFLYYMYLVRAREYPNSPVTTVQLSFFTLYILSELESTLIHQSPPYS